MRATEARSSTVCALLAAALASCAGSLPPDVEPADDPVATVLEPTALEAQAAPAGEPPAAAPPAAETAPSPASGPVAQEPTCSGTSGTRFEVLGALAACATVALKVSADLPYAWLMVAASAPGAEPAWVGGVSEMSRDTRWHWTFPEVHVPCAAGPYAVRLMVDAADELPANGREVDSCVP